MSVNVCANIVGAGQITNYKAIATVLANNHETRVLADGGILPDKLTLINFLTDYLKATNDLKLNYLKVALDAHLFGYKSSGTTASKLYALNSNYDATGSALLLPWNSADGNYWFGGGVTDNKITTPNSTATNIVGEFEFKCKIKWSTSYTDGTHYGIISKWADGSLNQRQFLFEIQNNTLIILLSTNGSTTTTISTALNLLSDSIIWLKITRNSTTGQIIVYKSTDGITYSNVYSITSITGNLFSGDSKISIGGIAGYFPGKVYEASMSNTIGGSPSFYFKASDFNELDPTGFNSSVTGERYTILNSSATSGIKGTIVNKSLIQFNGSSNYFRSSFNLSQPYCLFSVTKQYTWSSGKAIIDGNSLNECKLYQSGTTPNLKVNSGSDLGAISPVLLKNNLTTCIINNSNSRLDLNNNISISGNVGSNNLSGLTLGADGNLANFININCGTILIINKLYSDSILLKIKNILNKYNNFFF